MARESLPVLTRVLVLLLGAVIELNADTRAFVSPQPLRLITMPRGCRAASALCHPQQPCSGLARTSDSRCTTNNDHQHRRCASLAMRESGNGVTPTAGTDGGMQWRFLRHNQWEPYDAAASQLLETAIAASEESVTLTLRTTSASITSGNGTCDYVVSLDTSTQEFLETGAFSQRNARSGHIRAIRRAPAVAFQRIAVPELFEAPPLEPLAAEALRTNSPLLLRGGTFSLREELNVGTNGFVFKICGPGKIIGDAHTLFKVGGNRAMLDAEHVEFVHVGSEKRRERRELGAAVFVLGKAQAAFVNCSLTSEQGFGLWLSQQARARAEGCRIADCGRSAVVMFGHGALNVTGSNISAAGMHGICARGNTRVIATGCRITAAATRGVFAYENASLQLSSCAVSGTRDARLAAVQVESLQPGDRATLDMDEQCTFEGNLGVDLHVAGVIPGSVRCSETVEKVYGVRPVASALGEQRGKSWAGSF